MPGLALVLLAALAAAPPPPTPLRDWLVIGGVSRGGRSPLFADALRADILARGFTPPKVGDTVAVPGGEPRAWSAAAAGDDGVLSVRANYAYCAIEAPTPRIALLQAAGAGTVWLNGEPRGGDPYATRTMLLPVALKAGRNDLLVTIGRGQLFATLSEPRAPAFLHLADVTVPDRVVGSGGPQLAGVVVVNATDGPLRGLVVEARLGDAVTRTELPPIPPLTVRKVPVTLDAPAPTAPEPERWQLRLLDGDAVLDAQPLDVPVAPRDGNRRVTFISSIDGSVQYYGLRPAPGAADALVLTCHGAGVEGHGQSAAYGTKSWCHIVAPTNRRPFGFDWEDWGRMDALEVLDHAIATLGTDPRRTYLTGHSMGGHGAWTLAVNATDRFAATGPSAGWVSFMSYGGGGRDPQPDPLEALIQRAGGASDTLALLDNLHDVGVYILHGEADDNVPVTEARTMRDALAARGIRFDYHEEPGAGHWWDNDEEAGAACVDWPAMFDLFGRSARPFPREVRRVRLVTANPRIASRRHWLTIEAQQAMLAPASADILAEPNRRRFRGTTANVARLTLDLAPLLGTGAVTVDLDGGTLEVAAPGESITLRREAGEWRVAEPAPPRWKGPHRYGPFKEGLRDRFQIVYATGGSDADRAWAAAKARFDAETWLIRGNGAVDVLADTEFDPATEPDRGVLLIGNATTHGDWAALLGDSPVQVTDGAVRLGERALPGADQVVYLCRPRPGSDTALVAAVAPTGPAGQAVGWDNRYFVSGAAYPDVLVLGAELLAGQASGLRAAGVFGEEWGLAGGEIAVRE